MPDLAALLPVRAASVLAAAVFTPQAAAAIGTMMPPAERGRAITFVFLGWSLASVIGMPVGAFVSETWGWRTAFVAVALLSAVTAAAVWRHTPAGLRPPALTLRSWAQVFTSPLPMLMVAVTAASASGQFTLFSYIAPYYRHVLNADATEISLLFFWFGAFGLVGNLLMSRWIDRFGAGRAASAALACIMLTLAAWPLAGNLAAVALVLVPWALGCFSSNSAQQARLAQAAPAWAPALIALNTSAMYLGQGLGSAGGGLLLALGSYATLAPVALAWMALALAGSMWLVRREPRHAHA
jgi:predicted MFS family arabinose efflux permease